MNNSNKARDILDVYPLMSTIEDICIKFADR